MVTSFIIISFLVIAFDRTDCKQDWIQYKDSWYLFVPEKVTWYDAAKRCESRPGTTMAVPTSNEENSFIMEHITSDVWFGITEENHAGTWTDLKGEKVTYLPFQAEQPDHYLNHEHCIHINLAKNGGWNDLACDDLKGYVCQSSHPPLPVIKHITKHWSQSTDNLPRVDPTQPYWNMFYSSLPPQPYINYKTTHFPGYGYGTSPIPASYINNNVKPIPGYGIDYRISHWSGPSISYGSTELQNPYLNVKVNILPESIETNDINNIPHYQ